MNVFDEHPFKVIMDYGHNAHAVGVMADLAERLDVVGRRIIVLAAPGDRRDEDILAIADAVAGRFDRYICRRDDSLRGREPNAIPHMLASRLKEQGVDASSIEIIPDEQEAIDHALRMGRMGDLILVFADALSRSWKQVTKFKPEGVGSKAPRTLIVPKADDIEVAGDSRLADAEAQGMVRDERGLVFTREAED
jgi:cyanophycin synthetase